MGRGAARCGFSARSRQPKQSTLREPPEELMPADLDDAGLPVEVDGVHEEPGAPFFDELPVDDWAA